MSATVSPVAVRNDPPPGSLQELHSHLGQYLPPDTLGAVLEALSRPPSSTTLRVNMLRAAPGCTPQEACDEVNLKLQDAQEATSALAASASPDGMSWCGPSPGGLTAVQPCSVVASVHPSLPDCLVIPVTPPSDEQRASWLSGCCGREICVDVKCGEAVLRGSDIYAVGCKGATRGIEVGQAVAVYVDLDGTLLRGTSFGAGSPGGDTPPVSAGAAGEPGTASAVAGFQGRKLFVGCGVSSLSRSGMFSASEGVAVKMVRCLYGNHPPYTLFDSQRFVMVNEPSMACAHALGPLPGETVLDMCAAPGGKTTHLASLMGNKGLVVAVDRSKGRAAKVVQLCDRMGASVVLVAHGDSTKVLKAYESNVLKEKETHNKKKGGGGGGGGGGSDGAGADSVGGDALAPRDCLVALVAEYRQQQQQQQQQDEEEAGSVSGSGGSPPVKLSKGLPPASFDRILLDPPCSGLGQRPRIHLEAELSKGAPLAALHAASSYQRALIRTAVILLKPGGVMTYSTCTVNPEENEGNVAFLLLNHPEMVLTPCPVASSLGGPGLACCGLSEEQAAMVQRFNPSDPGDTIGFFVARFRKKEAEEML